MSRWPKIEICAWFLALLVFAGACDCWAYTNKDCVRCHEAVSVSAPSASAHAELGCLDCHTKVKDKTHESAKEEGSVNCGQCHQQGNLHGMNGQGEARPRCFDCHTKHHILAKDNPKSSVNPDNLKITCGKCHPLETGRTGYLSSFLYLQIRSHKKGDFSRAYDRSDCIGCHQGRAAHGETTPLGSEKCSRCHLPGNAHGAMSGYIHPKADPVKEPLMFAAALSYQVFIVVVLAALFWAGFRFFRNKD